MRIGVPREINVHEYRVGLTPESVTEAVTRDVVAGMKRVAVLVDVAIDQGGCIEVSRPATHADPTFIVDAVVHFCIANMPGAVARPSTYALNNATRPHVLSIAYRGWKSAMHDDPHLACGLNVWSGKATHRAVARDLGLSFTPLEAALAN